MTLIEFFCRLLFFVAFALAAYVFKKIYDERKNRH